MKQWLKWTAVLLALAVLITGAWFLYDYLNHAYGSDTPGDDAGDDAPVTSLYAAPDFTVQTVGGETVKLSDMKGKPIVLNFWATWCYFCGEEMPDFEAKYQAYGDDVVFMMVNVTDGSRDTVDTVEAYMAEHAYTFPVYCDTKLEAAVTYGASSLPVTFFIDADGNIAGRMMGVASEEKLQKGIDLILK